MLGVARPRCNFYVPYHGPGRRGEEESRGTRKKFHLGNPRYPYSIGKREARSTRDKVSRRCRYQMSKLSTIFRTIPAMRPPSAPARIFPPFPLLSPHFHPPDFPPDLRALCFAKVTSPSDKISSRGTTRARARGIPPRSIKNRRSRHRVSRVDRSKFDKSRGRRGGRV